MEKSRAEAVKNVSIVSAMTAVSRACGYLRDAMFAAFFGQSAIGAAFLLAFTIPNLFRRLLGEGALSSAIVPILSAQYVNGGKKAAFTLFNRIIWRMLMALFAILALIYCAVALLLRFGTFDGKWIMALTIATGLLPYALFVCLAAVITALLNILGHFFTASLNQIWMNLSMILAILLGGFGFGCKEINLVYFLIGGVLVGGFMQLLMPMIRLFLLGWRPSMLRSTPQLNDSMRDIWRLFFPGIFGAAVEQLNILVTRVIAYGFCASSVTLLYLAVRITELPTGIFGLAITTVFFPDMAKIVGANGGPVAVRKTFRNCLVALLWILIPSAIGLFVLRREIVMTCFAHGRFYDDDALNVASLLSVYCLSMVFSGVSTLVIRGFHSIKDTKTPALIGTAMLAVAALLSFVLMRSFGLIGLASAAAFTTTLQATLLLLIFGRRVSGLAMAAERKSFLPIAIGGITVAIVAFVVKSAVLSYLHCGTFMNNLVAIAAAAVPSIALYLLATKKLVMRVLSLRGQ
jgi:putative peptidoglycan lipid II flippase